MALYIRTYLAGHCEFACAPLFQRLLGFRDLELLIHIEEGGERMRTTLH